MGWPVRDSEQRSSRVPFSALFTMGSNRCIGICIVGAVLRSLTTAHALKAMEIAKAWEEDLKKSWKMAPVRSIVLSLQRELRALSHILKTPIEVIQAESSPIVIGEEYSNKLITLVYMRHAYGLGEHYNSVEQLDTSAENI